MKMGYQVLDSQANYLFFEGEPDLYEKLLEEGVMIRRLQQLSGALERLLPDSGKTSSG